MPELLTKLTTVFYQCFNVQQFLSVWEGPKILFYSILHRFCLGLRAPEIMTRRGKIDPSRSSIAEVDNNFVEFGALAKWDIRIYGC